MSICGKFCFEDFIDMEKDHIDKLKIYLSGHNLIPLAIKEPKDLIPYYPYLIGMSTRTKDGDMVVHLSEESYIDREEREHLGWRMDEIKKYYRKCKRKFQEFNKEEALSKVWFYGENPPDYIVEMVNRVATDGNKATIDDLHDPMHEHMRKLHYDLMVEAGWDSDLAYMWVYGFSRWCKKHSKKKYGVLAAQGELEL